MTTDSHRKTVILSDEAKYELRSRKRRTLLWRQPGQVLKQKFVKHTVKHVGGAILV